MSDYIYFNSRDELYRIDVSSIVYFKADGNYTSIVLADKYECLVSMNLGNMEKLLSQRLKDKAQCFARIGKCHIINLKYLFKINTLQQKLLLSDQKSFLYSLDISKDALKRLKEMIVTPSTGK